jgi:hypothetical protein
MPFGKIKRGYRHTVMVVHFQAYCHEAVFMCIYNSFVVYIPNSALCVLVSNKPFALYPHSTVLCFTVTITSAFPMLIPTIFSPSVMIRKKTRIPGAGSGWDYGCGEFSVTKVCVVWKP